MNAAQLFQARILGVGLLVVAGGTSPAAPQAQTAVPDADVQALRQEMGALTPDLEKGYAALDAKVRAMPRVTFEPAAVIEQVGRDPAALEKWVAGETDLLPYRGALRGAAGVMMDRGGNSLDRSLLLASMLQSAGFEVRLANAKLSASQAAALAKTIPPERAHRPTVELAPECLAARARVERQTKAILDAIGGAPAPAAPLGRWEAAVSDHWWVQRREGAKWVDADACAVSPVPAAARTVALKKLDGSVPLEAKDCQEVVLSVVVEAVKDGKLTTGVVMQRTFRPAEMFDRRLTLYHFMGNGSACDGMYASDAESTKRMRESVVAQESFLPVLAIGANEVSSASFSIDGTIDRSPSINPLGQLSGSKAMTSLVTGLSGAEAKKMPDMLSAEWIEYEIRVPGDVPHRVRRMVFDLIGPAARAAAAKTPVPAPKFGPAEKLRRGLILMGSTQIAMQPCEIPAQFVALQAMQQHLHEKQVWVSLSKGEFKTFDDLTHKFEAIGDPDVGRSVSMARGTISPVSGRVFIDRPNVINYRLWAQEVAGGAVGVSDGMDMAYVSEASLDGSPSNAFAALVAQGVTDTLAEQWGRDPKSASVENTLRLSERASAENLAPVVARWSSDLDSLAMPADVRARAESDLAEGNVLVAYRIAAGRYAWWRIDARTGRTIGVMDDGYNGDDAEYPAVNMRNRPAHIRQHMSAKNFNSLNRQQYSKLARVDDVPQSEWDFVEQLQGKVREKAATVSDQFAKARFTIKP